MPAGLGALIVARRQEMSLTRKDLARRLHVAPAQVIDLERSRHRWQTRLLPALSDVLGIPQLELAIAAGVITDLPTVPHAVSGCSLSWLIDDVDQRQLAALAGKLHPAQAAFLLSVANALFDVEQGEAIEPR